MLELFLKTGREAARARKEKLEKIEKTENQKYSGEVNLDHPVIDEQEDGTCLCFHGLPPLFHEGQQDDPAKCQQGEKRRQHVELPADVASLRTLETAVGKRECRHEHHEVIDIAHDSFIVKVSGPDDIGYGCQDEHNAHRAAHLHARAYGSLLIVCSFHFIFDI